MNFLKKHLFSLFFILFIASSCQKPQDTSSKKPLVLVSIPPYKYFVEKIAGDTLNVKTIVPKDQNAHLYSPTIKELSDIQKATLFFRIGESFEEKILYTLTENNPEMKVVDLRDDVNLIPIEHSHKHTHSCLHGHYDIHFWLSPNEVQKQIKTVLKNLNTSFPENKELYTQNYQELKNELHRLDKRIKKILPPYQTFLTSHAAFAYFCKDYKCNEIPVEYSGKEISPRDLERIIDDAKKNKASVMILIPQFNNQGAILVAKWLKIPAVTLNPYSDEYEQNLILLAKSISNDIEKSN